MSTPATFRVLQPSGMLNALNAHGLLQELQDCLEAQIRVVLVDLCEVDFIDSSGLGLLVAMHTKLRLANGKLYLCSPKEQASNLFDISDMDQIFEIFHDRNEFYTAVIRRNQALLVQ